MSDPQEAKQAAGLAAESFGAGAASPTQPRPVRRVLNAALGVVCLLGPLLGGTGLLLVAPGYLDQAVVRWTDIRLDLTDATCQQEVPRFSLRYVWYAWQLYGERVALVLIARVYDVFVPAIGFAGLTAAGAVAINLLAGRLAVAIRWRILLETALFVVFLVAMALGFDAPAGLALVAVTTVVFFFNFPLTAAKIRMPVRGPMGAAANVGIFATALTGVTHLIAPVVVLGFAGRCFRPGSPAAGRWSRRVGQGAVCLITLPVVALAAYSSQPIPLSPQARCVLSVPQLYDVEIDPPARHVIVTRKTGGAAFVLNLDTLEVAARHVIPTAELEDIELDPATREIFQVDRETGIILVLDADSFRIRRRGRISDPTSMGSTKLALDPSTGRLLVSWENNNLFLVDRASLGWALIGRPGNVNLASDPENGLVYINSEWDPCVAALDLRTLHEVRRAPGPRRGERMVLSEKRHELYAPDAEGGQIWVYSTPDLRLLRKLPAQFGVRPMAVDDEHGLLLSASVVTGYIDVTDLATGRRLARHYVGKFGRILRVDPSNRRALMTLTNEGLYTLTY